MKENKMKDQKPQTIKAWRETRSILKMISAKQLRPMTKILHELVVAEWNRIKDENVSNEKFRKSD